MYIRNMGAAGFVVRIRENYSHCIDLQPSVRALGGAQGLGTPMPINGRSLGVQVELSAWNR